MNVMVVLLATGMGLRPGDGHRKPLMISVGMVSRKEGIAFGDAIPCFLVVAKRLQRVEVFQIENTSECR
jgi:hypothetical protein